MSEYEKVYFEKWQHLAKAVIDGDEYWLQVAEKCWRVICFDGTGFNYNISECLDDLYIKKQPTLAELIAIKPRLCWVWDGHFEERKIEVINEVKKGRHYSGPVRWWQNARMLTDDEIKQFLNGE